VTSDVETVDPLRLEVCPSCGYSLEGLPGEGRCPECGRHYNQSVVVLHGWARGQHASVHTAPFRTAVWLWVAQSAYVLQMFINPIPRSWWWAGPVLVAWVAFSAWIFWRRRDSTLPGLVQVLLSAAGCAQLDDPTRNRRVPPTDWSQICRVELTPLAEGRYRFRALANRSRWNPASTPVDAEVKLSTHQAEALRQRVSAWRAG
jgi:hypothetical protein